MTLRSHANSESTKFIVSSSFVIASSVESVIVSKVSSNFASSISYKDVIRSLQTILFYKYCIFHDKVLVVKAQDNDQKE